MTRVQDGEKRLDDEVTGHLGGDVVGRPAEGRRPGVALHVLLAHAEVCNLDVAVRVQQHVVQFQVSAGEIKERNSHSLTFDLTNPHHPPSHDFTCR